MSSIFKHLLSASSLWNGHKETFDSSSSQKLDEELLKALLLALEVDIVAGTLPMASAPYWALDILRTLPSPRHEAQLPTLHEWPSPDQPWIDSPQADPREQLLARLLHQGLDPWQLLSNTAHDRHRGTTLAASFLGYGYPNLFRLCLKLPGACVEGQQGPPLEDKMGWVSKNLVQLAVEFDDKDLVVDLLDKGGEIKGALACAQSGEMAQLLMEHGARLDEVDAVKRPVQQLWEERRSVKVFRELTEAVKLHIPLDQRLNDALKGKSWTVVQDALNAWPEWQDHPVKLGTLSLRRHVDILSNTASHTANHPALTHALRMLKKFPPDDREVAPGISELCWVRAHLARLSENLALKEHAHKDTTLLQLAAVISKLGVSPDIVQADAKKLIQCASAISPAPATSLLGCFFLAQGLALPYWDGMVSMAQSPKLENFLTLGRASQMIWAVQHLNHQDRLGTVLLGDMVSTGDALNYSPSDPRHDVWIKLAKKNPARLPEITQAAFYVLGAAWRFSFPQNSSNKEPLQPLIDQVQGLIDQGGMAGLDMLDIRRMEKLVEKFSQSPSNLAWAHQLLADAKAREIETVTPSVAPIAKPRRM